MEEARFVLRELGVTVCCPVLGDKLSGEETAVLFIADGLGAEISELVKQAETERMQVIVLNETRANIDQINPRFTKVVNEFASALYIAAWAAGERQT
jgi:hypothetical protein